LDIAKASSSEMTEAANAVLSVNGGLTGWTPRSAVNQGGAIEAFRGGLFNGIHHQQQICVQRAIHLMAPFAGAILGLSPQMEHTDANGRQS
jgi:hypothetical protein